MRTTLDLDERVLTHARTLSAERRISLGAAVSELALRGLEPRVDFAFLPSFSVSIDTPPLTPEMVREALDS